LYTSAADAEPAIGEQYRRARRSARPRCHAATLTGDFVDIDYVPGNDAVTSALTTSLLQNEFLVNPALGAATDWVVTLPTEHFYVDRQAFPSAPIAPFHFEFTDGGATAHVTIRRFDRAVHINVEDCPIWGPPCVVPTTNITALVVSARPCLSATSQDASKKKT
jgi:hypothetical protein